MEVVAHVWISIHGGCISCTNVIFHVWRLYGMLNRLLQCTLHWVISVLIPLSATGAKCSSSFFNLFIQIHTIITPILFTLHWLLVQYCIDLLMFTFKALNGLIPLYLFGILTIHRSRALRLSTLMQLDVPWSQYQHWWSFIHLYSF